MKSVLTTFIGFFTFGGVPATSLTVLGVVLNTLGGVLYSIAKYLEKKASLRSVHDITMQSSSGGGGRSQNSDIEKGIDDVDTSGNDLDNRTRA